MKNRTLDDTIRFDFTRPVKPMNPLLLPVTWLLSLPETLIRGSVITKTGMEGLKPPYLLLVNHNSFYDFKAVTRAVFPHRANNVVAIDGFVGREWLLRAVGCICKRKFTSDILLIKQMLRVIKNKNILALYPEARYSLCGTTAVMPASLGKIAKLLGVPVVVMINSGHHLLSPFWNTKIRKAKPCSQLTLIVTAEETALLSAEEIDRRIEEHFHYDDFRWQKDNNIVIDEPFRAEKLHKVLYQCPACRSEYTMDSSGDKLYCRHCGKEWHMTELGELRALSGDSEFTHIPDWYEWQRSNVKKEIEAGTYSFKCSARVRSLPNADKFIDIGMAELTHDMAGFKLTGKDYEITIPAAAAYSVHIEYEYLGKFGDCVDLNTQDDTLYVYPQDCLFSVTKMALATEELYKSIKGTDKLICE